MDELLNEPGLQITIVLFLIPVIFALILILIRVNRMISDTIKRSELKRIYEHLSRLQPGEISALEERRKELEFQLSGDELSENKEVRDPRGLIDEANEVHDIRFLQSKREEGRNIIIPNDEKKLILWFLGCSVFWLFAGTTVGEYLGIKFVAPDADHISWLSFGRLRPVHTNIVFWGWASMAMVGFSYYVIPRVGNTKVFNLKIGYITLILMNSAVLLGSICLMAGINNSGGEYREYIWPVMLLFAVGIIISIYNHINTIAFRKTEEIYVSNWYIVSAMMFVVVILIVAYLPFWQDGLGETITQGYFMHQGVGMWFMFFNLGLMYYFLPQELNSPVYSYSLSILAFWTQILFYTLIGTHHFIFSAIPWWMQTIAIVASVGMVIPVAAGSINFMMTIRGSWHRLKLSYVLPFYVVSILFYFTGSMQGTAEAFRATNLLWHFTDFTVAHSHLTMYGIITFMLWSFTYTLVPRLTSYEPPSITVGLHFWLALIGVLVYTVSLMIGSTEKGMMWMEKKPFIEGVVKMMPFWLWRAIGGTMMWISHIVFAYNFYRMIKPRKEIRLPHTPQEILEIVHTKQQRS
ncbi:MULTISPECIES: cbb3-type cytochrome c oxidase subunit I [Chryseobacterium]|uniref:Cbb3-type cytochrome c oxidase subunit I n=1 Tax=Chryseobacterium balustinum TaxID=246 RepID=A0AAX2ILV7_9FLAO|nr:MULTISPECIES: cbb3-type cytochrome c oxidase subunit I [Chryseobacterium]AZB29691.1 cytochrome oxidase subunit I [Chryseobacterium balustinum]MBW3523334.1 cbb3-type cytochrome c oxidase subunit I [Chryseobacterium sp. NKUCC03_KSP]SKB92006.1 cytochrome c oxidase cbb3-type subunit 1 [Chryseobacterium balustinum]SQA90049.1 cbb3-type cytochrome c oxidase subunit I [Chryseobacterium balustinum]